MRQTKVTSTETMTGNLPGQIMQKTPDAIQKEAEKLKGKKVPIRNKDGTFTGKYAENFHAETVLYADTDLGEDEKISLDYTPVIEDSPTVETQHELNLNSIYVTAHPRMVQQSDSMPETQAPPAPVETYEAEVKELISIKATKLGITDDGLKELKGLSPREQLKQLSLLEKIAPRKDEGKAPQPASTGNAPVLPVPNINPGPQKLDTGIPYEELPTGKPGVISRLYKGSYLFGNKAIAFKHA